MYYSQWSRLNKLIPVKKHIFVGMSKPVLKIIGGDPLSSLKDQEYVVRSVGDDIVLYGKGIHGNLYAVLDFMENTLGHRFYTESEFIETPQWDRKNGQPVVPAVEHNLNIKPFDRKGGFSFAYRIPTSPKPFHYQQGLNMGFSEANRDGRFPAGVVSFKYMPVGCHTLFSYIPPTPEKTAQTENFRLGGKEGLFQDQPRIFYYEQGGYKDY